MVITAYQNNEPYAGLGCFAYEINEILVNRQEQSLEIGRAIGELDQAINESLDTNAMAEEIILYRGCTLRTGNPEKIRDGVVRFHQYLSTSRSLSEAVVFADKCDRKCGELHVLKILYPNNKAHIKMLDNTENEILLPRGCSFAVEEWNLTEHERENWTRRIQPMPNLKYLRLVT